MHAVRGLRVDVESRGHDFLEYKDQDYHFLQFHLHPPSEQQIQALEKILDRNVRPVQPLHKRAVTNNIPG